MSDHFDFLALPLVIQDLIVEEIVHNSIPEDRIQFSMACKVFNEMVKRAKPKKIIRYLFVFDKLKYSSTMIDETKMLDKSLEEMIEIFKKCQIKELIIWTEIKIFNPDEEESHKFLDDFLEICEFVTELYVFGGPNDEFIKFFKKLKHLKSLDFQDNFWLLEHCPYLPKEVFCDFKDYDESSRHFLLKLAEKSQQEPLRFISTNGYVPVDVIQEFLKPIFSGELLTYTDAKFTINDVDRNDWIKVDAGQKGFATYYGNEMLNDCFPKNADESWMDYYDNINRVLGTKIVVAKPETLANMIGEIAKIKALFLKVIHLSSPILFLYLILKIFSFSFFGYL
uniref:F-box domain-containing protein n=1 Tax=Panagrolaimus sp. JU765 TaxID=591449 RepID=A0AC34RFR5_9BILA